MTEEQAVIWVAGLFEESPDVLTPATLRDSIAAWDSLGVLTLMAALDEKFEIILTDEEMRRLERVDDILEILRENGKLN